MLWRSWLVVWETCCGSEKSEDSASIYAPLDADAWMGLVNGGCVDGWGRGKIDKVVEYCAVKFS